MLETDEVDIDYFTPASGYVFALNKEYKLRYLSNKIFYFQHITCKNI